MMDARLTETLASAGIETLTVCGAVRDSHPSALSLESRVIGRDERAAATVRRPRSDGDLARRFHGIAMGVAIIAMGILAGAVLGSIVAPTPAHADGRHAAATTRTTPASSLTPAAGAVRTKVVSKVTHPKASSKSARRSRS